MQKIQKVSLLFRILFQVLFVLFPMITVLLWFYAPTPLGSPQMGIMLRAFSENINILHPLSLTTKFLGFIVSLIPLIISEFILYFLIKLFMLYEKGQIFALKNVYYINKIGCTLLIGQVLNPIYEALISGVLTWHNPPGHRFMTISLSGTNLGILLVGFLVILISWIMAEGYKLREEQKYTI